jgi:FkbM family methyltransferase
MFHSDYIEKINTIYGQFYSPKRDMITNQLKQYSAHTRNELAMLKTLIRKGDNIIDIGAHIGTFSIPFAKFNNGLGKIFSFEADADNYDLLRMNISENCLDNVIMPIHAVVHDIKLAFTRLKPCNDNSAMYCFLPDLDSSNIDTSAIDVINIDEWYEHNENKTEIAFIKIDVEGSEMAVLSSCKRIIGKYNPLLYIEINRTALDRFKCAVDEIEVALKSFGYHFFRNIGPRNSNNDIFKIARLNRIEDGGNFFDLLAVHPSDYRYPDFT